MPVVAVVVKEAMADQVVTVVVVNTPQRRVMGIATNTGSSQAAYTPAIWDGPTADNIC